MNPHFYRLRKGTVEKVLVPRRGDGECERDSLRLAPCVGNSNRIRVVFPTRSRNALDHFMHEV